MCGTKLCYVSRGIDISVTKYKLWCPTFSLYFDFNILALIAILSFYCKIMSSRDPSEGEDSSDRAMGLSAQVILSWAASNVASCAILFLLHPDQVKNILLKKDS